MCIKVMLYNAAQVVRTSKVLPLSTDCQVCFLNTFSRSIDELESLQLQQFNLHY